MRKFFVQIGYGCTMLVPEDRMSEFVAAVSCAEIVSSIGYGKAEVWYPKEEQMIIKAVLPEHRFAESEQAAKHIQDLLKE